MIAIDSDILKLPKAELHVHIEGTVTPDMARKKAAAHGLSLPADIFSADGKSYEWGGFVDLVTRVYDAVAQTVRTRQDYEDIAYDYLKRCAAENCLYVELIISPDHAKRFGLSYKDMVEGIAAGIDRARADFGIEARMNAALVRHLPQADVDAAAQTIVSYKHPYVVGLDLAGAEKSGDIPRFRPTFKFIKGWTGGQMGWRIHAAEAAGAENARAALDLHVKRIGHGVRAVEDPAVLADLVKSGTHLEICPTSNVLAGLYPDYKAHPLTQLRAAGVRFSLNSDDPGLFGNSIGTEYQVAHDHFGLSPAQLSAVTRTAIEDSFVDDKAKKLLLQKVDAYGFFLNQNKAGGPNPGPTPAP